MESLPQTQPSAQPLVAVKPPRRRQPQLSQPVETINIPGALLKVETLAVIAGRSITAIYRDAKDGRLELTRRGPRCTRIKAEHAQAYLKMLYEEAA